MVEDAGDRYLGLKQIASLHGLQYHGRWKSTVRLENEFHQLRFEPEQRRASIDGVDVWLHTPVRKTKLGWSIAETDHRTLVDPLLRPTPYLDGRGCGIVVLDAGHGGEDTGTSGHGGSIEKILVLDIARKVGAHLKQDGLTVHLTRADDRFITLEERPAKARRWKADLFVSIHANSAGNKSARGAETFVLTAAGYPSTSSAVARPTKKEPYPGNRHDAPSALLGYAIQKALLKQTGTTDRGLRRARFVVLREAPCPAALVECGFLSHTEEAKKMLQPAYREKVALGIYQGIVAYRANLARGQLARGGQIGLDPVGLENYQRYAGPTPLPGLKKNASGLAYRPDTSSLLIACNDPPLLCELDLSGRLRRTVKLSGFEDVEGVSYLGGGTVAVVEERRRTLCLFDLEEETTKVNYREVAVVPLASERGDNNGLEAVAVDPVAEEILLLKEKEPRQAYLARLDPGGEPTISAPWDLKAQPIDVDDFSGACRDERSGNWLILSDESRCLLQVSPEGKVLGRLGLRAGESGLKEDIPQPEGVAVDARGRLFICSEPNLLYVFGPPRQAPVPASAP